MAGNIPHPSKAAVALARAMVPPGRFIEGVTPAVMETIYHELAAVNPRLVGALERLCAAVDLLAVPLSGSRFSALPGHRQEVLINRWYHGSGPIAKGLQLMAMVVKLFYFDSPELYDHYGVVHDKSPEHPEPEPAYMQQAMAGHELDEGEELEADVVVVGSGAAGAIVAKQLAERGHAVLLVEQGKYFRREDFSGQAIHALKNFYDWNSWSLTLGNVAIPVPAGRTVGGSTTINTATSFRPPGWVHQRWEAQGLPQLSRQSMAPLFEELEAALQIEPVKRELWGPHVEHMNAALDRLGYKHGPIRRNAPDCDGQNTCDMGCPSGGKFSMDRSYVPMALRHGAMLLTETRLQRVLIRGRKVRGVELVSGGKRLTVAARRVVLCCGAISTPGVLWDHDLGGDQVGQHLTIHPSCSVFARFGEVMDCFGQWVPSSHSIEEFFDQGILMVAANIPLDFAALPFQMVGRDLVREMERYERFGTWGVMVAETSKGRLVRLPGGRVVTRYDLNRTDLERLHWGMGFICEMYFSAGAEACFPSVQGWPVIRDRLELARFKAARINPGQLAMTSYHPLGTCRMGQDPRHSVVTPDYEVRDVQGLSVVDGSVVPGPLGINSQLTVMAFALQASQIIHRQLESA